jgi:hypothetical protein
VQCLDGALRWPDYGRARHKAAEVRRLLLELATNHRPPASSPSSPLSSDSSVPFSLTSPMPSPLSKSWSSPSQGAGSASASLVALVEALLIEHEALLLDV